MKICGEQVGYTKSPVKTALLFAEFEYDIPMINERAELRSVESSGGRRLKAAFISHSSTEGELAQEVCGYLERHGFPCWIAPRDVKLGEPYALGCLRGVAESASLVLLASEKAVASVQVLSEVEQAHKRAKPIYTVLIPPAQVKGEMDYYLSRLHWLPAGGRTAGELAAVLAKVLGQCQEWKNEAAPPSWRRTMRFVRPLSRGRWRQPQRVLCWCWERQHGL